MFTIARKASQLPPLEKKCWFFVEQVCVGLIPPRVFDVVLQSKLDVLQVIDDNVHLSSHFRTVEERTSALESVLLDWKARNLFQCLKGWRNERFQVWGPKEPLIHVERAAVGLFGCRSYGCHVNGLVKDGKDIKMWIARRSKTKQTYPGKLDNLVGGGLSKGTPIQCAVRECAEEASIPSDLAQQVEAAGIITFWHVSFPEESWTPHTEFIYDLQLDASFEPVPEDGEVECFYLMTLDQVKSHVLKGEFSPEAGLVVMDYLIRSGFMTAENEPDYLELCKTIKQEIPFCGPRF
ncbi:NUDIX hydrolase domain-like protein [Gorgonomyces haynaldii]|nr:NUDIX hydrolase domain-like protein [Gorgonomyces haynaldii]